MKRTHWIFATTAWAVIALLAFVLRDELAASMAGTVALVLVFAPAVLVLYFLVHGVGEGLTLLLLAGAFKVVTLGLVRTELTATVLHFPWYGFARSTEGAPVASENAVALIGIATYLVAGVAGYFFFFA